MIMSMIMIMIMIMIIIIIIIIIGPLWFGLYFYWILGLSLGLW